jgi:hypothetical protein
MAFSSSSDDSWDDGGVPERPRSGVLWAPDGSTVVVAEEKKAKPARKPASKPKGPQPKKKDAGRGSRQRKADSSGRPARETPKASKAAVRAAAAALAAGNNHQSMDPLEAAVAALEQGRMDPLEAAAKALAAGSANAPQGNMANALEAMNAELAPLPTPAEPSMTAPAKAGSVPKPKTSASKRGKKSSQKAPKKALEVKPAGPQRKAKKAGKAKNIRR